ncbi:MULTISPECIES: HNH endonuclease signature motif containing protein [unclassified Mesorhizobium]|uniref:HNH endonuclease signature motif containing protein n=1 Tax=unclassified Mesorhizobium TaxID=325217 RepID=UPI00112CFAFB|nr:MULTISPECIES: HNH endonuclease signature motif containing protein [unclassified Mesorhizobium]TPJ86985.1 HNH endonuclease [Mesorhizobium sp. B2-5-12]TPK19208.1 HNH endonuclease [Mesorhizobium sp. B2-5-6]
MTLPLPKLLERFFVSFTVDEETGCWNWTGEVKPNGYGVISKKVKGKRHRFYAHRFSAEHVAGKDVPADMDACHECDNRRCVNPDHLFVGTRKKNMEDCVAKGRQAKGDMLPQTVLTEEQVQSIRADDRDYETIADAFGVGCSSVSNIKNLKEWSWLPVACHIAKCETGDRIAGEAHYCAKLTEEKVAHIRTSDEPLAALAVRYGVSYNTVLSALTGKTWRRVTVAANDNRLKASKVDEALVRWG